MTIPFSFEKQIGRIGELGILPAANTNWKKVPARLFSPGECATDWNSVMAFVQSYGGPEISGFNNWIRKNSRRHDWDVWFPIYQSFRHSYLYQITPADVVFQVSQMSKDPREHALSDIRPREQTDLIKNIFPTPPLVLSFHTLLEALQRIPSFTEFWSFHLENQSFFMGDSLRAAGFHSNPDDGLWQTNAHLRTIRYRIGNAYYNALKEINILAGLRHRNCLDVKYHFVIDLEWKADLYLDDLLIEIYVANKNFKTAEHGRKVKCEIRNPSRSVLPIEKEAGHRWGQCWLHSDREIDEIASAIRGARSSG